MKAVAGYVIVAESVENGKWAQVKPWSGIIRSDPHNQTNEGKRCVFDPDAEPKVEIEPGVFVIPYSSLMAVKR